MNRYLKSNELFRSLNYCENIPFQPGFNSILLLNNRIALLWKELKAFNVKSNKINIGNGKNMHSTTFMVKIRWK